MKFMLTIVALLATSVCFCQDITFPINQSGQVEYTGVVTVDSTKDSELYSRAKLFIANAFVSSKDVTQLNDDNAKIVLVKGLIPIRIKAMGVLAECGDVRVKATILCKDGRYKYSFTDFYHQRTSPKMGRVDGGDIKNEKPACGTFFLTKKQWLAVKQDFQTRMLRLIDDLNKAMHLKTGAGW